MNNKVGYQPSADLVKITQALGFLLNLDENHKMNRVKLIKLLWAADRLHMRRFGRTVTETEYYALPHGPVCSLALNIARLNNDWLTTDDINYISEYFTKDDENTAMNKKPDEDYLSETDKQALIDAWELFKYKKVFALVDDISHRYPEWSKHEASFAQSRSSILIDQEDFFKNPRKDPYFEQDAERLATAQEVYNERKAAQKELTSVFGA